MSTIKEWGALKSVLSNSGFWMIRKKCLYERMFFSTALYGAKAWGMRSEINKVGVFQKFEGSVTNGLSWELKGVKKLE